MARRRVKTFKEILVDPSLKRGRSEGGVPPHGHPRQCHGTKRDGDRCTQWAMKGSRFCHQHGGREPGFKTTNVVSFYGPKFSQKFRDQLAEIESHADKRMELFAEIDVARSLAAKSLELFDKCFNGEEEIDPALKAGVIKSCRTALSHVAHLVTQQAKLDVTIGATMSTEQVGALVHKVTHIVAEELQDHPELMERVTAKIANLRVLDDTQGGGDNVVINL